MKPITLTTLLIAASALASCQTERAPRDLPPVRSQPTGITGSWVDPNGIVSTFAGGTFTTRTTDTNQLLASGTYVNVSPTLVEINMTSLVRNTQSKVNCAMVNQSQLNCTTDSGAQFSLARRA
ncbi:MAG: outer membrane lipoprotein Omp10 [Shinella sp.]|nr:outer membrane lipoprotein Omp10 [Shinella sp.]